MSDDAFWVTKKPASFTRGEWESLCDGCGKCCLHKYEDIDSGRVHYTSVSCRYLDTQSCRCTDYSNRAKNVPDCVTLTPKDLEDPYWLPSSCAYKLVAENKPLPDWHPLVSKNPLSTYISGNSVSGRVISETVADDPEDHYIDWITT